MEGFDDEGFDEGLGGGAGGPVRAGAPADAVPRAGVGVGEVRGSAVAPPEVPGYDVRELLGRGSSGDVWAATRCGDGAPLAVKVVPVGTGAQAALAARELAVLARVDVEGLVQFHEAVGLAGEPPAVAVVLDRVGGGSLARVVAARGHLSAGETVTVLAPVARALAGLHAAGVVHGDVSPANVLLELSGRPLLADLGVARVAGAGPDEVWGTQGFVAPEVLDGRLPGPAADVYAVGALAWWCATGEPPGPGALRAPVDEVLPDLPEAWRRLTARALAGDPGARPGAAELALGYFDAVPCEPLRMTVGADETSLLTQRIRDAGRPSDAPAPRSTDPHPERLGGALRAAVGRLRAGLGRLPVAGLSPPRWSVRRWSVPRAPSGRLVTTVLLLAALAAVVVPAGVVVAGGVSAPGWLPGDARTAGAPQTTASSPSPPRDPLTDRRAPQRDARGLAQALADDRARLVEAGDPARLGVLDAPGSQALRKDTDALRELADRHERYAGVRLTARAVRLVTVSATKATIDASVDTAAYEVVGTGHVEQRPATTGEPLRLLLVWHDGRWKVDAVTDQSAG
ncbi:protein kinase [Pedococcus sp. NPDC057267]|uniref:serine/threonine-protein kinase n=1 Tax=Pedococcus sp. NPDC057267 TaxID=3346077 RepID=UPI00364530D3